MLSRGPTDDIIFEGALAAEKGDFNVVRDLLEELEFDNEEHTEEWRILEEAAANGHLSIVDLSIESLDDNAERDSCGYEERALTEGKRHWHARYLLVTMMWSIV